MVRMLSADRQLRLPILTVKRGSGWRMEKRSRELGKKFNEAKLQHSIIENVLERNKAVEFELA